jgi:hypothetical protein
MRLGTGSRAAIGAVLTVAIAGTSAAAAKEKHSAEIRAFRPQADTYVSAAAPRRNFGGLNALRVDSSPEETVFLRFRLKKLKGEVTGVTLLLHAQSGSRRSYQVRRVYEDEWREDRLTYRTAPTLSPRYAASRPVRLGSWSAVDVSAFVTEDDERVSLAITTRSRRAIVFSSRESSHGPRLVVRTEGKGSEGPSPGS